MVGPSTPSGGRESDDNFHRTPRIHHAARRRSSCVATPGTRAGADAESWTAYGDRERPRCAYPRESISPAPGRAGLVGGAVDTDHVMADAAELIRASPDVIVTNGAVSTTEVAKATSTISVVFVQVPDPVDLGVVPSLARPGGNITGFTHFELTFAGKWLEALKDMAPQMRRVLLVTLAGHPALPGLLRTITGLESSSGGKAMPAGVHNAAEVERAIEGFAREPNGGLIVLPSPIASTHRDLIIALAARHRLPAIYPFRYFPEYGGLSFYGIDTVDLYRRAASYVDRILKGEKPADLPVQAPTKYELVINLKTAKA